MLKKNQLARIWDVANEFKSGYVKDGKTYYRNQEEMVLEIEEIFDSIVKKLTNTGFSIERVSPKKANGIIRVFRRERVPADDGVLFWVYGADTFLKTFDGMRSSRDSIINYGRYDVKLWLCQDEYLVVKSHFVDYYVKISEKNSREI